MARDRTEDPRGCEDVPSPVLRGLVGFFEGAFKGMVDSGHAFQMSSMLIKLQEALYAIDGTGSSGSGEKSPDDPA